MDCERAKTLMMAMLGGASVDADRRAFEAHLAGCESCRREFQSHRFVDALVSSALAGRRFDDLVGPISNACRRRVLRLPIFRAAGAVAVAAALLLLLLPLGGTSGPGVVSVARVGGLVVKDGGTWRLVRDGESLRDEQVVVNRGDEPAAIATPRGSAVVLRKNCGVRVRRDRDGCVLELVGGELFASVNHEPFKVVCDGVEVAVKGTKFWVRRFVAGVEVVVEEGVVECRTALGEVEVSAGQRTLVRHGYVPETPAAADVEPVVGWAKPVAAAVVLKRGGEPAVERPPAALDMPVRKPPRPASEEEEER